MNTPITKNIIKEIKKLHSRKYREELQLFLVEGERIAAEAVGVKYFVVGEGLAPPACKEQHLNIPTYFASEKIFSQLFATETPQGILAVCEMPKQTEFIDNYPQNSLILLLDQIQDPGNLGTIIRTAECAGASAVILSKGCADLYNPKVVRSTMGAIFRLPIFTNKNLIDIIKSNSNRKSIAMSLSENSQNLYNLDIQGQISIIIGNEANGISEEVLKVSDIIAKIPMAAGESLNAAIAAAVTSFEWRRQNG